MMMSSPEPDTPQAPENNRETAQPSAATTSQEALAVPDSQDNIDTVPYQSRDEAKEAHPTATGSRPTTFGRYRVLNELGRGGFGVVFVGFDEQLRRRVAIKVPPRCFTRAEAEQSIAEARRLAQFRHPGIVTVFDVGVQDG